MKISEGSTEEVARGEAGRRESKRGTRTGLLNILCPGLANEHRVPPKPWYTYRYYIYLFIDIAHFLFSWRTAENHVSFSFLIYNFSRLFVNVHYLHGTRKVPRATCFSRFFCADLLSTFQPLLFHFLSTSRFVLSSQFNKTWNKSSRLFFIQ